MNQSEIICPESGLNELMVTTYSANGKLLLSGEYLVRCGANALVLPLKVGQHMQVTASGYCDYPVIKWHARVLDEPWFEAVIGINEWNIVQTSDKEIASRLVRLLKEAGILNHLLFIHGSCFDVITHTDFNMEWGFGSSSSLVANVAHWAMVDPFELQFRTFGGSGADIAAAISDGPVLYRLIYQKPVVCRVGFKPSFFKNIWLIYLGRKQDTMQSISELNLKEKVQKKQIHAIDEISLLLADAKSLQVFMKLIREHELILSSVLEKPPVKDAMFNDFPGEVKSLGAWGGDFVMAVSEEEEQTVRDYFSSKNMSPVFSFDKIIR